MKRGARLGMIVPGLMSVILAASLATAVAVDAVSADEVADFYRGRTVTIVVGHEVGTGFDLYGRALARHLENSSPGPHGRDKIIFPAASPRTPLSSRRIPPWSDAPCSSSAQPC